MKRLIYIITFLLACTQVLAESDYVDNNYYYSTPHLSFIKTKHYYLVRLNSNDSTSNIVQHREKLVFIINKNDSVILPRSYVAEVVLPWKEGQYSASSCFELKYKSTLLNKRITEVLVLMDNGSIETYKIAKEYQEDFKKDIYRKINLADVEYEKDSEEGSVLWQLVFGVIALFAMVFFIYKASLHSLQDKQKTIDIKQDNLSPVAKEDTRTLINQEQYNLIRKHTKNLHSLIGRISRDKKFLSSANEQSINAGGEGISAPICLYGDLHSVFVKDLHHCFDEMGYSFHYTTRTEIGQCLYLIYSIISGALEGIAYDYFEERMKNITSKEMAEDRNYFENKERWSALDFPVKVEDEFKIPSLLLSCNGKSYDAKQYLYLLYSLASILAEVNDEHKEQKQSLLERMKASIEQMSEKELNNLIGLQPVKEEVQTLSNFIAMRQKRKDMGLIVPEVTYHLVFTGNPGTGKTTVARILASIFRDKGILKKGHLVETDRSGLVAEYVGQTAVKTNKIIDKALDGVLFIDEAYSLIAQGEDFGQEAIATLLKRMEDDRDRLIVILAGYTKEMEDFINSNPGLRSRFNRYIFFPDYSADELSEIFFSIATKHEYTMTEEVKQCVRDIMSKKVAEKSNDFGNARFVRNLFEKVVQAQANRLANVESLTKEMLAEIKTEDIAGKV